jgi:hypothetical protein
MKTGIELESDADVSMGEIRQIMPTSVLRMEISVDDVLPDGSANVRTRIVSASARERPNTTVPVETVNAQAMLLGGLELTGTLTPRGRLQETRLAGGTKDLPAKTVRQIEEMLKATGDVAMPLPDPGVGVGAVWRIRKDVVMLGVKLETITEVEITALEGPRVAYRLRTEVKGDDQTADIDGLKAQVTHVRGGGTGKGVIDLSRMAMTGEQEVEMSFDVSAMNNQSTAKMKLAQRARSAIPPPAGGAAGAAGAAGSGGSGGSAGSAGAAAPQGAQRAP